MKLRPAFFAFKDLPGRIISLASGSRFNHVGFFDGSTGLFLDCNRRKNAVCWNSGYSVETLILSHEIDAILPDFMAEIRYSDAVNFESLKRLARPSWGKMPSDQRSQNCVSFFHLLSAIGHPLDTPRDILRILHK